MWFPRERPAGDETMTRDLQEMKQLEWVNLCCCAVQFYGESLTQNSVDCGTGGVCGAEMSSDPVVPPLPVSQVTGDTKTIILFYFSISSCILGVSGGHWAGPGVCSHPVRAAQALGMCPNSSCRDSEPCVAVGRLCLWSERGPAPHSTLS